MSIICTLITHTIVSNNYRIEIQKNSIEAVVEQGHKVVTVSRLLWIRSPLERINYYLLLCLFLRSSTKAKSLVFSYAP